MTVFTSPEEATMDTTTLEVLVLYGRLMRERQTAYFKDRSQDNLRAAKSAEASFDKALGQAEVELAQAAKARDDAASQAADATFEAAEASRAASFALAADDRPDQPYDDGA